MPGAHKKRDGEMPSLFATLDSNSLYVELVLLLLDVSG